MPALDSLRAHVRSLEDWWFDCTRRVETAGDAKRPPGTPVIGDVSDSYVYLPVRVKSARDALHRLPIGDFSNYTFIDIGSGKGRMLFVGAEFPFARVIGVEFDEHLHAAAVRNVAASRPWRRRCVAIEPILANAAEYEFPPGALVVYLFNPFGPDILNRMLDNLARAFTEKPRHILLLMLWPEHADVVARRSWLRSVEQTRRYRLFAAGHELIAA